MNPTIHYKNKKINSQIIKQREKSLNLDMCVRLINMEGVSNIQITLFKSF